MAGIPKYGLEYIGVSTRIFDDDERIDRLIDSQGCAGFIVYIWLYLKCAASNGYYYRFDLEKAATIARKIGGGLKSETVRETIMLCLQIGLFDNRLFEEGSILTSKEIQRFYQSAITKRSEVSRTVNPDYWLLDSTETNSFIIVPENRHSLPENSHSLPENATKKSKVNKSKVNKTINSKPPVGGLLGAVAAYSDNKEITNALKEFIKMRKDMKRPLTDRGLSIALKKLDNLADTDAEKLAIIEQTLEHSWQIFYELKAEKKEVVKNKKSNEGASYDLDLWEKQAAEIDLENLNFRGDED